MTYKSANIVLGEGETWPTEILVRSLTVHNEISDAEWWRRMAILLDAVDQTGDKKLKEALNLAKIQRFGSGFPVQEVASPQNIPSTDRDSQLNFYAPTFHLKNLLSQPWFATVSSNDRFNQQWTDTFIESLMNSEWSQTIAIDWASTGKRSKVLQIKAHIVGLLADNQVLKGSLNSIAEAVNITDNPRTFARYMSEGRKQPYADWVRDYISHSI